MKKAMSLLLTAAMVLSLAACGSGTSGGGASSTTGGGQAESQAPAENQTSAENEGGLPDAAGETLRVWMPTFAAADGPITDQAFWERELAPLAEQTGCTIEVEIVPWDSYEEKYLTGIASGEGPDVGYMYMEMFYDYIVNGQLADISSYFSAEDKAHYLYYDLGDLLGGQYALPVVVGNPRILIGNTDILEAAGIDSMPTTWDELVEACKKVQEYDASLIPLAQDWGNPHFGSLNEIFWPYFWSAGGQIVDDAGNLTIDTEAGLHATQFLYDLRFTDKILTDSCTALDDTQSVFEGGDVAFIYIAASNALRIDAVPWEFVTSLDSPYGGAKTFVAADCLVMLSGAQNKELAAAAMKLMTSGEVMGRFHKEISSQMPITDDETYTGDARFNDLYLSEGDKFQTLSAFEGSAQLYDTLFKNLQQMMLGDMSPEQVLSETTDYYNQYIKE